MHVPELRGIEVAFTDISRQNLDMCRRSFASATWSQRYRHENPGYDRLVAKR
jgi:hypothetical protein